MRRYQTEVIVPPDRYVAIQLPPHLPEGRAIVIVQLEEPDPAGMGPGAEGDLDRQDIEWWEEFEDADPGDPRAVPSLR